MEEDQLAHLIELASITADMMLAPDYDPLDWDEQDDVQNLINMHQILAKAFVELVKKHGEKPRFRVKTRLDL